VKFLGPIDPGRIYRYADGEALYGLKHSQLAEAINKGLIPRPFKLIEGGRASGWTGAQVLEHQRERQAAAAQQLQQSSKV
jgi:predicted DNA-binding transcriptional regulator AlpA